MCNYSNKLPNQDANMIQDTGYRNADQIPEHKTAKTVCCCHLIPLYTRKQGGTCCCQQPSCCAFLNAVVKSAAPQVQLRRYVMKTAADLDMISLHQLDFFFCEADPDTKK